jgi:hypothetical protein
VEGNFSAKRPYWNGYHNVSQKFQDTNFAQVMNLSNNNDFDAYGIKITNQQNITFELTGDYQFIVSPEFWQSTGNSKIITFWIQKNGVDVAWSNSRYTILNGQYFAPAIPYQIDITNTSTDWVRIMWYSDSIDTYIYASGSLTSPPRPSIPGVLLNIQKVSEITP